jgi:hypothetical protein
MRRSALVAALALAGSSTVGADPVALRSGAVEIGVAGSITALETTTRAQIALRAGSFLGPGRGLLGYEGETAYSRIRELDRLDLAASVTWVHPIRSVHPFLGVTAGVRQEWLGSFRSGLPLVGAVVGIRMLASPGVGFRLEYRPVRFFDDLASDFTEHQILFGISFFLRT